MPMRLNVGASRKITDNNYGSRGASVNLEIELGAALIGQPDKLRTKIRQLFRLVRASLAEELQSSSNPAQKPASQEPERAGTSAPASNGNGTPYPNGSVRPATPAQIKAIVGLAKRQGQNLAELLLEHARVRRPEELTLKQASLVIDTLKSNAQQPAA